jgi:small subunit ribosomal protein S20
VANIKSAKKRAKQTVVRNARNTAQRSMLRTAVKKVIKALDANDAEAGARRVHHRAADPRSFQLRAA